ncbi:MAG TPA: hypothetical protein VGA98_03570 [Allosphingosinicella sp.]
MPKLSFISGRAFDTGLAALAAVSAGFVVFAMPDSLFSGLVETSRLPEFVPAAQPPLGDTARLAALGSAALLTFSSVWALMAGLGRVPARRKPEAKAEAAGEAEAPRLRRADAHPDAPARRPLLARDLGEPLDLHEYTEAPAEAARSEEADARPLPGFLVPQAPEPEPVAEAQPEESQAEPEGSDSEPERPAARPEVSATEPPAAEAEPDWVEAEPVIEPEPEPEPQPQPLAQPRRDPVAPILPISEMAAQLPEGEEDPGQSLSQLVNRIEFGLSRKRQALPTADLPPVEEMPAEPEKVGHRLRSAINDLQKIASSGA